MNQPTTTLAATFRALLADCVGPQAFARILSLNTEEQDTNVCHSHDFCDPNQIMLDAWEVVFSRPLYLPGDVEEGLCTEAEQAAEFALMGDAWTAASLNNSPTPPPFAVLFDCAPTGKPEAHQYFTTEAAATAAAAVLTAAGWPGVKVARTAN